MEHGKRILALLLALGLLYQIARGGEGKKCMTLNYVVNHLSYKDGDEYTIDLIMLRLKGYSAEAAERIIIQHMNKEN